MLRAPHCTFAFLRKAFINPHAPGLSKFLTDAVWTFFHVLLTLTAKSNNIKHEARYVKWYFEAFG